MLLMHALLNAFSRALRRRFEPLALCLTCWQTIMGSILTDFADLTNSTIFIHFTLRKLTKDKG